ncbi:hypothetical protein [Mitsuokella sp.]|uniref:hypothetical protein n=1 Tax=unclassified Mitsuokella TaxID=2637239 RepID=UPI003D7E68C3
MNENEREERREEEPRVRVMSQDETENYRGVTIEENPDSGKEERAEETSYQQQNPFGTGSRIHIHTFPSQSQHGMSWLTKAALIVGGAAVLGFFFFVALPFLLIAVGVGVAAWLLFQWLRG